MTQYDQTPFEKTSCANSYARHCITVAASTMYYSDDKSHATRLQRHCPSTAYGWSHGENLVTCLPLSSPWLPLKPTRNSHSKRNLAGDVNHGYARLIVGPLRLPPGPRLPVDVSALPRALPLFSKASTSNPLRTESPGPFHDATVTSLPQLSESIGFHFVNK